MNLKKLEILDLSGCIGISDLTPLQDLTSLKILKIGCGKGKPPFGFAELAAKLPKLKFPGMSS